MRNIYADNAATTKMSRKAIEVMNRCAEEFWGNPSSLYSTGQSSVEKGLLQPSSDSSPCSKVMVRS